MNAQTTDWIARCAARLSKTGEFSPGITALDVAGRLADEQREINGVSGQAWVLPVDAADQCIADEAEENDE